MTGDWLPSPGTLLRLLVATTTGMLLTAFLFNPYTSISSSASSLITEYPVVFPGRKIKPSSYINADDILEQQAHLAISQPALSAVPSSTDAIVPEISVKTVTGSIAAAPLQTAINATYIPQLTLPVEAHHDAAFFLEHNVYPASWKETFNTPSCIVDYAKRTGLLESEAPLRNWDANFAKNSSCPVFPIPEGGFIFHMHWEGNWGDAFELAIDSFLATQNLAAGHRLIFWHGKTTPPPKRVLDRYAELAPTHVKFKALNHAAIARGTCYARNLEWTSAKYRQRAGMGNAAVSNLLRTMLLAKYGGVWVDSDVVFIRDMTSLLRSGPFAPAYHNGLEKPFDRKHYYNNHIISVGRHPSPQAAKMLDTLCTIPFDRTTWNSTKYNFEPFSGRTTNDGLLNVCEHNTHRGLAVFPLAFVESETWTPPPLLKPCVKNVTEEYANSVFKRTFLWHSRQDAGLFCPYDDTGVHWAMRKVARALPLNLVTRTGHILEGAE